MIIFLLFLFLLESRICFIATHSSREGANKHEEIILTTVQVTNTSLTLYPAVSFQNGSVSLIYNRFAFSVCFSLVFHNIVRSQSTILRKKRKQLPLQKFLQSRKKKLKRLLQHQRLRMKTKLKKCLKIQRNKVRSSYYLQLEETVAPPKKKKKEKATLKELAPLSDEQMEDVFKKLTGRE